MATNLATGASCGGVGTIPWGNLDTSYGGSYGSPTWGGFNSLPYTGGSNQYMNYPTQPSPTYYTGSNVSGVVPSAGTYGLVPNTVSKENIYGLTNNEIPGQTLGLQGGAYTAPTYDPTLTTSYYNYLQGQLGGTNNLQNQLLSFLSGGASSIPGASSLANIAQTGEPISQLPGWQAMIGAQQNNIQQNLAQLQEQYANQGNLGGSPYAMGTSNYLAQTTADQNSLLAQMQTQALQQAVQNQLSASGTLFSGAQNEDQFMNQLLAGGATASPGIYGGKQSNLLGGLGALGSGVGSMLGAAPGIAGLFSGAGAGAGAGGAAALGSMLTEAFI